jgi:hypothetical protein
MESKNKFEPPESISDEDESIATEAQSHTEREKVR